MHHGQFPLAAAATAGRSWVGAIHTYIENINSAVICPDDPQGDGRLAAGSTSYVVNEYMCDSVPGAVHDINRCKATSKFVLLFEGADNRDMSLATEHCHPSVWFSKANVASKQVLTQMTLEVQINRHSGSANYLFADGHTETIAEETIGEWAATGVNFAMPQQ